MHNATGSNMNLDINKMSLPIGCKAFQDQRSNFESCESVFWTKNNLKESLSALIEELDCLDISSMLTNPKDLFCAESLRDVLSELINASWRLVRKQRSHMKILDEYSDTYSRAINDNSNLKTHLKRLKEDLEKKEQAFCRIQERERRLKVKCDDILRELKRESDEVLKLKKQSLSKDTQHEHEMRRAVQNEHKLREQLHKKFVGTYAHKEKTVQNNAYANQQHEKEIRLYKQTIRRLEENNRLMLHEINELKEALALSAGGIDLQIEASGIWTDLETLTKR